MGRVQVEGTPKPIKAAQALTILGGLAAAGTGLAFGGHRGFMVGAVGIGVALVVLILLRIVAWWQTG